MIIPFQLDTLDIVTTSGIDAWGKPQMVTTASGVTARVELGNRITLGVDGEQSVSNFTAFLNPEITISVGNRVVYSGDTYEVLEVLPRQDDVKLHHLEVVGKIQRRS